MNMSIFAARGRIKKATEMLSLSVLAGLSIATSSAHAGSVTYDVNISYDSGAYTVVGTITTDGASSLQANDITSYDLTATNSFAEVIHTTNFSSTETVNGQSYTDPGNHLYISGTALTASTTSLFFNFASPNKDELEFYNIQFFASTTDPSLLISGKGGFYDDSVIGTTPVPLPSGLPLVATGAVFVLLLANRKKLAFPTLSRTICSG